jgi:hypothetical protein
MRIWNQPSNRQSLASRPSQFYNRILALFLVLSLMGSSFAAVSSAADEVVTALSITSNAQTNPPVVSVEDGSINLTATATISGTTRDVTQDATWTSTSSLVKVSKGVLTATGAVSSVTITATYKTVSQTIVVKSDYAFDDLKIQTNDVSPVDAPTSLSIDLGKDLAFTAVSVLGGVNTDATLSAQWLTSNSAVATVDDGKVTLISAGTVTITAKSKGRSDSIALTVSSPYSSLSIKNVNDSSIEESIQMEVGTGVKNLKAQVVYKVTTTDDTNISADATWTSSNSSVVKVEKGAVTAVGQGMATVTAKRFGVSDAVTFIVRTPYEVMKVTPDKPITLTLYSPSVELKASVLKGSDAELLVTRDSAAEWKVADLSIAALDITTDPTKVFVQPKGVGSTKVTVTYKGLSKEFTIAVYPTISTVEIAKDKLDAFTGDTGVLPAVSGVTLAGNSMDLSNLVKWKSLDTSIVTIEDGKWKALKTGTVTLEAQVENESGKFIKDTITIDVHNKILALIPNTTAISVVIGKEVDLPTVQLIYEDGEEEPLSDKIVWKSSTANLLIKGTKMKGLLPASATLTGTYLGKTVTIKVQVEEEFTSFDIQPKTISLTLNKTQTIKVTGSTKSGKKVTLGSRINWNASNESYVTVKGASVKGIAEGTGKLTATVQGKSLEIPYAVTAKLSKLTVSSTSLKPTIGQQEVVELSALFENGKTISVTAQGVWTTSNSKVATVSVGKITAIGKGSTTIKATYGGKTVIVRVSVK